MFRSKGGIDVADIPTLTKHDIRDKVWSHFEEHDLATFPRPVSNRIPNFKGAGEAGQRVCNLQCFTSAQTIKVNPDKPQEEVRFLTLEAGKVLLVPTPRLRSGLFNRMEGHASENKENLRVMAQTEGMKKHSKPVGLDMGISVDLIVIGSVAVSRTGRRIGKGEGFADLEYAMMRTVRAVDDSTPIVTTVHDCQVFDELPSRLFGPHDVPVDFIVTPSEVIQVNHSLPKPEGIYWHLLSPEKFRQVPILRVLRDQEHDEGKDVTLAEGADLPSVEELRASGRGRGGNRGVRGARVAGRGRGAGRARGRYISEGEDGKGQKNIQVTINVSKKNRIVRRTVEATHEHDRLGSADLDDENQEQMGGMKSQRPRKPRLPVTYAVFLGKVPPACRVRELKDALQDRSVRPIDITWRGRNGFAFLRFTGPTEDCDNVLEKLDGLTLLDQPVVVERAKDKVVGKENDEDGRDGYYCEDDEAEERVAPRKPQVPRKPRLPITFAVFLGKVPPACRVRELKEALQNREVQPVDITWRGRSGFAFLRFTGPVNECDDVLSKLEGLTLQDQPVVVERAKDKAEEEEEEQDGDMG
ncbi:methenyltetrahydrofolate synthase domain-containing protein-like isoform X2 [Homarus americanus]|uniref:methenyltetrahydrofolate synthase domain-containing protein-like isoform X2 n=1 Tax=Homarus americanus TaxID=6706 RepID=UPI001C45845B|nr:methenyltetrahydrofolate synthase domain-containing protein-like isoform X2 [Homarus americanus]